MRRRPTAYDVAKAAGVSQTLVSFVLNGRDEMGIAQDTRARVLDAALKLGYQPNRLAKALSVGRTRSIALWTYGVYDAYYSHAIWRFREIMKPDGYDVQVVETNELIGKDATWRSSEFWPVDGILAFESPACVDAFLDTDTGRRIPVVSVGAYWSEKSDFVGVDLRFGAFEAVNHLVRNGNRRIAWFGSHHEIRPGASRYDGYLAAVSEAGLKPEFMGPVIEHPADYRRCAFEFIGQYIEAHGCPEAIFCEADEMMIGALRRLRDIGLRVPQDVALVGCDGIPETDYHEPRLSTVASPTNRMCSLAWQFLRNRIENPDRERQSALLRPVLRVRESSDCIRKRDR